MKRAWMFVAFGLLGGCRIINPAFDEADSETGTGDDLIGDGDGDPSSGDGDPSTGDGDSGTGDGDGDPGDGDGDPGDGDGDPGDGDGDPGDGDGDMPCLNDQPDLCGDACTNVDTDVLNCGECDKLCADGESCKGSECLRKRIMFVTQHTFDGALGGLLGADDECEAIAGEVYPGKLFWAWNSTLTQNPNNTFDQDGYFVRSDQVLIANSWAELTSGQLQAPIDHDENGVGIPEVEPCNIASQVWTGTNASGEGMGAKCLDWSKNGEFYEGSYGNLHATDATWSLIDQDCNEPPRCNQLRRLYCLER